MRPLCSCGQRPRAVNYHKNNKVYYRKLCEVCLYRGTVEPKPRWMSVGYRLKDHCEKCGFRSKHSSIFQVFHVDGNLNNCRPNNLKTVCSNCNIILSQDKLGWKQGDLIADN